MFPLRRRLSDLALGATVARASSCASVASRRAESARASSARAYARDADAGRDAAWLERRKAWTREVNVARKAWRAEREARARERAELDAREREEVARARAERLAERARARAARAGASATTREEAEREREREMRVVAGRRRQRQHAMSLRRQAREIDLLKQSRGWIETAEELEARIEHALANPERLFK